MSLFIFFFFPKDNLIHDEISPGYITRIQVYGFDVLSDPNKFPNTCVASDPTPSNDLSKLLFSIRSPYINGEHRL